LRIRRGIEASGGGRQVGFYSPLKGRGETRHEPLLPPRKKNLDMIPAINGVLISFIYSTPQFVLLSSPCFPKLFYVEKQAAINGW